MSINLISMRSLSVFLMVYFTVSLVPSTETAGLFGALLGENDNNNNNYNNRGSNTGIPLISSLGLGLNNRGENNQPNTNYNQYTNNNANRGLLSPLLQGANQNYDRPNVNNFNNNNQFPNTEQQNPNYNDNEIKKQMNDAEKLLERLKEMNRLKEQNKFEGTNNRFPNTGQNTANNNVSDLKRQMQEVQKRLERLQELNRLKEQKRLEEMNNNQGQRDTEGKGPEVVINNEIVEDSGKVGSELKAFTKKRFFFIAQPVVPQDEAVKHNQTVYYVD